MRSKHNITCEEYAKRFNIKKGKLNPHHAESMTGKGNPRYGIPHSKETKKKISSIHKKSGKFKGKRNPMYGKTHSQEVRKKISNHYKGLLIGEKNPFFGKKHTKETKKKISKVRIEKGIAKGERNPLYGRGHTKETKAKISKIKKAFFRKYPEKHINSIIAKNYKKQKNKKGGYISKKQIEIYELIKEEYKDSQLNLPIKTKENLYFADVGMPSIKLDLEYDSSYWHQNIEKDIKRDNNIKDAGWRVIRIKDEDIKGFKPERIKKFISEKIKKDIKEFQNAQ